MTSARCVCFILFAATLGCDAASYDPCPDRSCGPAEAGAGGGAGPSGGGAGTPGKTGGVSGQGAGAAGTTMVEVGSLSDCGSLGTTVEAFEKTFFPMKCGTSASGCHNPVAVWGDFSAPPLYPNKKALGKASLLCAPEKVLDPANAANGILISKVTHEDPVCGDGSTNGARMPERMKPDDPKVVLTAQEIRCLTAYAVAVTK